MPMGMTALMSSRLERTSGVTRPPALRMVGHSISLLCEIVELRRIEVEGYC